MIQASELRIGNWIHREDIGDGHLRTETVLEIGMNRLICSGPAKVACTYDEVEPIPLTEEWLLRFGLYPDEDGDYLIAEVYFSFNIGVLSVADDYYYGFLPKIQSVHQLQNLNFALTKQELKLNDK